MPIHFPQEVGLRDARRLMIRPLARGDVDALHAFFLRLPEAMKRCAWDRIESREVVERWTETLDSEEVVSLVAWDESGIVADATLHYRSVGPLRLVGRVKWLIDPAYRGAGVGTALITNFIQMARENGLRHLTCMLLDGLEDDAVRTLREMGFEELRVSGYGTDPDGEPRDMVKMVLRLEPDVAPRREAASPA